MAEMEHSKLPTLPVGNPDNPGAVLIKRRWHDYKYLVYAFNFTVGFVSVVMGLAHLLSFINTCLIIPGFLLAKLPEYATALAFFLAFSNVVLLVIGLFLGLKGKNKRAYVFIPVISPILAGIASMTGESREAALAELTLTVLYDVPTAAIGVVALRNDVMVTDWLSLDNLLGFWPEYYANNCCANPTDCLVSWWQNVGRSLPDDQLPISEDSCILDLRPFYLNGTVPEGPGSPGYITPEQLLMRACMQRQGKVRKFCCSYESSGLPIVQRASALRPPAPAGAPRAPRAPARPPPPSPPDMPPGKAAPPPPPPPLLYNQRGCGPSSECCDFISTERTGVFVMIIIGCLQAVWALLKMYFAYGLYRPMWRWIRTEISEMRQRKSMPGSLGAIPVVFKNPLVAVGAPAAALAATAMAAGGGGAATADDRAAPYVADLLTSNSKNDMPVVFGNPLVVAAAAACSDEPTAPHIADPTAVAEAAAAASLYSEAFTSGCSHKHAERTACAAGAECELGLPPGSRYGGMQYSPDQGDMYQPLPLAGCYASYNTESAPITRAHAVSVRSVLVPVTSSSPLSSPTSGDPLLHMWTPS